MMRTKINNLKFIINLKHIFTLSLALLFVSVLPAQEIIEEVQQTAIAEVKVTDSSEGFKPRKVDAVAAVVGDYIVLESDVYKEREQFKAQGANMDGVTNCELFGSMLEAKLYAHHAIQDSLIVSDAEVRNDVDYKLDQFLQSTNGSMERILAIYKKDDEKSLRDEMFQLIKSGMLSEKMQKKIVEEVEITP